MQATKKNKSNGFRPDFIATSVMDINYKLLAEMGIKAMAFDVDGTLIDHGHMDIDATYADALTKKIHEAGISTIILASNTKRSLNVIGKKLRVNGIVTVQEGIKKPQKAFYKKILAHAKLKPENIAMVGDRPLQDIWGANKSGLYSIAIQANKFNSKVETMIGRNYWQPKIVSLLRHLP
jgi:HAD superfamily phosphatase (TIGR01668 family)